MAKTKSIIDMLFRKTLMLKPMADGTFEVINITGDSETTLLKKDNTTVELKPKFIYKVNGLKNTANICIKEFNGTQLVDLFNGVQEPMTEPTLMNMLENAENAGRLQAEGGGAEADKWKKQIQMIFLFSIITLFGIVALVYMKARGM